MHDSVNAHTHAKLCSKCCVYAQIIMLKIYAKKNNHNVKHMSLYTTNTNQYIHYNTHALHTCVRLLAHLTKFTW